MNDAILATNFIRSNFLYVPQRTLAHIIYIGIAANLPGYAQLDYHQQSNLIEAIQSASGTAGWATIYGRIRRYDKARNATQAGDFDSQPVEQNEQELATA